jgi:hypothetical protein
MHVVWKRPDGFHGADPADYVVVNVGSRAKIWLHRSDRSNFPFRIAGDWQEAESGTRLNQLVNLLGRDEQAWLDTLVRMYDDTMGDDPGRFVDDLTRWVRDLCHHLKGDTWEIDIMTHTMTEVADRLHAMRAAFVAAAPSHNN